MVEINLEDKEAVAIIKAKIKILYNPKEKEFALWMFTPPEIGVEESYRHIYVFKEIVETREEGSIITSGHMQDIQVKGLAKLHGKLELSIDEIKLDSEDKDRLKELVSKPQ